MTLQRRGLLVAWVLAALALGGAQLATRFVHDPLDDPDLAMQRPGFLDFHHAPFPAPPVTAGIPSPGRRAAVFFARPELLQPIADAVARDTSLRERAQVVIVVAGEVLTAQINGIPVTGDHEGRLAAGYMMRRPRDGGAPVGYAVVDSQGRVRYPTLDPDVAKLLDEVETIVKDTP